MDEEALNQRKEYDLVINERDILGTQLIRRNDELALLNEKVHTHTHVNVYAHAHAPTHTHTHTRTLFSLFGVIMHNHSSHILHPMPDSYFLYLSSSPLINYPPSNQLKVHQSALKAGEVHYLARVDDIRVLKINVKVSFIK